MPIRKPRGEKKQNPLLAARLADTGEKPSEVARKTGVSRSRMNDALYHAVGYENASKIAEHFKHRLGLTGREELELRAELMGTPGNLVRAYLGTKQRIINLLEIDRDNAGRMLDPEGNIAHDAGLKAADKLTEMEAPDYIVESVRRRTLPPVEHDRGRGRVTYQEKGPGVARRRRETRASLARVKPRLDAAIQESGLGMKELAKAAGIGRETLRQALYAKGGAQAAEGIATALGERLGLPEEQVALIAWEIIRRPKGNL